MLEVPMVLIDGMRLEFPDGWALIRASNTSPVLVLRFEAENQAALARIQAIVKKLLVEVKSDLAISF